jgi:hypothetical protein
MGQHKSMSIQGTALYKGEPVAIIDVLANSTGKIEYMINYNGPIWVNSSWLTNIVWLIN